LVLTAWAYFIFSEHLFEQLLHQGNVVLTMIAGAFIAGSSPEGSAAIAYPVFTLFLDIEPDDARNFAFAIQSIGMTSASLYILGKRIRVDWRYVVYVTAGGIVGIFLGTWWLVPLLSPIVAKLAFVSLWLAFGLALYGTRSRQEIKKSALPTLQQTDILLLLFFGLLGGGISALFGTGINMLSFCLVVLYFNLDEKVATPSSILIMNIETWLGFFIHGVLLQDISHQSWNMWLACIPVVIFMAPLGAWFANKISRFHFQNFLYLIFILQYIGAVYVIRPGMTLICLSLLIILSGLLGFRWIKKQSPFY
jgi:uncharacterized membrane protein YfcA